MRAMKDSGVEWIGEIPEEWKILRNKNAFFCNKDIVGDNWINADLLSLTTRGVKKKDISNPTGKLPESFNTYQYVKSNNLVMCLFDLDCSAVFSGLSSYNGMISPAYKILNCKSTIIPHFADYWFIYISDGRKFNHYAKNIRYTLNYDEFSILPILIPSIDIQQRIADYLDTRCAKIDTLISQEQTVIEKLKEYKQSLITQAVTKGLDPDVPMKNSGVDWIGDIPTDWELIKMVRIIVQTQNGLTRRDLSESTGQIVLKLKNISESGVIDYSVLNRIKLSDVEKRQFGLSVGDFLFVRVNGSKSLVGKCAIFQGISELVAYNDHIIRVKFTDFCNKHFINWYLLSSAGKHDIELHINTAAGQFTISGNELKNIKITFPPYQEQQRIADYLDNRCSAIDATISKKQTLIDKLTEYKKSLIYEVVTGKKEV